MFIDLLLCLCEKVRERAMDWREKALTGMLLVLLILCLTFGPIWPMAFPILLGMIASAVNRVVEIMKTKPILPVSNPAPAADARVDAPAPAVYALALSVDALVDAPAISVDAPVDAADARVDAPAPAVDALALSVDAPVDAPAISVDAPVDAADARVDAPAPAVDSLALSVDAPVDAPAISVDAPALAVDAPALSIDAPVDDSDFGPAHVASGIRMRRRQRKLVVKLDLLDGKDREKAMQAVSGFGGIGSLKMDIKDNKLTVSGDFDPVKVVNKLRKSWHTEIVRVDDGNENEDPIVTHQAYYLRPHTYHYVPYEE